MSDISEYASSLIGAIAIVGSGWAAIRDQRNTREREELKESIKDLRAEIKQQRTDMDAMAHQINDGATRLTVIETEQEHRPKIEEFKEVYRGLNEMKQDLAEVKGTQAAMLALLQGAPGTPQGGQRRRATDRTR